MERHRVFSWLMWSYFGPLLMAGKARLEDPQRSFCHANRREKWLANSNKKSHLNSFRIGDSFKRNCFLFHPDMPGAMIQFDGFDKHIMFQVVFSSECVS